mgnify:CR=1 FL=1
MPAARDRQMSSKTTRHVAAKAARRAVRSLMDRFLHWLEKLAAPHADFVESTHQLRVTSRRADVALRVFKDWLPHEARKTLRRTLKEVRFDGGIVRDLDLLELQWRPSQGKFAGQTTSAVSAWMHQQILKQREQARRELIHWTRKSPLARVSRRSHSLVRRIKHRGGATASASLATALQAIIERLQKLLPETSSSLQDSHLTRIAARHLRYALELLRPFLADEVAELSQLLTQLQDHLGAINDEATAIQHLMSMMETCHEPLLLPELQQQLERTQLLAAERLSQWKVEMPGRLEQLGQQLQGLHIK